MMVLGIEPLKGSRQKRMTGSKSLPAQPIRSMETSCVISMNRYDTRAAPRAEVLALQRHADGSTCESIVSRTIEARFQDGGEMLHRHLASDPPASRSDEARAVKAVGCWTLACLSGLA